MTDHVGVLAADQVHAALTAAVAAPSMHDDQPWRFRCTANEIDFYAADRGRREPALAAGAALLNLRVAIRAMGVFPDVRLLPDRGRPELLARVRPANRRTATPIDRALAAAILRWRTDHEPFRDDIPVPAPIRHELRLAAEAERAWLAVLERPDDPLIAVVGSFEDGRSAWLRAGQAMQRVLLTATAAGLSVSFVARMVEVPAARRDLRARIGGAVWPQAVLRLGYGSSTAAPLTRPAARSASA